MQVVDVDESQQLMTEYPSTNLNLPCSSTDMMYLICTSGSTGNSKGFMEDHVSLVNIIDWLVDNWELSNHSSVLLKTAVSFDPSVFEIFAPLALGGRLVIAKPGGHEDYHYMRDLITAERYSLLSCFISCWIVNSLSAVYTSRSFTHTPQVAVAQDWAFCDPNNHASV